MSIAKFNQENNCVAIGTMNGFAIYTLDPIELRYKDASEGIGVIEMLYCTSLVALVGSGHTPGSSPRKLKLQNLQTKETICELNFPSTVLDVKLCKQRMIICLQDQIHIYDLNTIKCIQILSSTATTNGLIAYAPEPTCYLAFPTSINNPASGSGTTSSTGGGGAGVAYASVLAPMTMNPCGGVLIYDTISLRLITQINAHRNGIASMEFSADGKLLATASSSGTMIRVFALPSGKHLYSFRRGAAHVTINSLSFDASSQYILAGTSTGNGTIHVFSLAQAAAGTSINVPPTIGFGASPTANVLNSVTSTAYAALTNVTLWSKSIAEGMGMLPEPVSEFANSYRACATIKLPESGAESRGGSGVAAVRGAYTAAFIRCAAVGMGGGSEPASEPEDCASVGSAVNKIAVVTEEGHLYRYVMPPVSATATAPVAAAGEDKATETTGSLAPVGTSPSSGGLGDRASLGSNDGAGAGSALTAICILEDEALLC